MNENGRHGGSDREEESNDSFHLLGGLLMVSSDRGIHLDQYVCIHSNAVITVFDRSALHGNN